MRGCGMRTPAAIVRAAGGDAQSNADPRRTAKVSLARFVEGAGAAGTHARIDDRAIAARCGPRKLLPFDNVPVDVPGTADL